MSDPIYTIPFGTAQAESTTGGIVASLPEPKFPVVRHCTYAELPEVGNVTNAAIADDALTLNAPSTASLTNELLILISFKLQQAGFMVACNTIHYNRLSIWSANLIAVESDEGHKCSF